VIPAGASAGRGLKREGANDRRRHSRGREESGPFKGLLLPDTSPQRQDVTGLNDRALVERYEALRADLDRTRHMDKRLALHRELQNLAAERQRRHPLAITPLHS